MKKIAIALAAAAASFLSTGAMAAGYVGGAVGQGHLDADCSGTTACDNDGTAYKLFGGYAFDNGLALELGYLSFGEATATVDDVKMKLNGAGVALGVAYQWQFSEAWGANFRLGMMNMDAKAKVSVADVGSATLSETNIKPYYGLGVNYAVNKSFKIDAGVDFSQAEFEGEDADVRAITIGARFSF